MFSRILGIPLLLGAAIGVPYLATNGPHFENLWSGNSPPAGQRDNAGGSRGTIPLAGSVDAGNLQEKEFANVTLREAFRFDITREWVYQQWARKSTALSQLGLYGIRVALVTGTELQDVAGSLTYLFGQDGRLQQISFRGRTGDTTPLVMLATRRYGLQPQPTAIVGEQLYQVRRGDQVLSELRTRPSSVLKANSPHDSFEVKLELQRSDVTTPLPSQLPPLPALKQQSVSASAESTAQNAATADADTREDASGSEAEEKQSERDSWKAFFPRSRVPSEQVESLDKRGRLW